MLDAPGPWGTGPFVLSQGYSSIYNVQAIIQKKPFQSTWITTKEERTPYVTLDANARYWNPSRGPRLSRVVFRNDVSPKDALRLCVTTEGQVDLVTGVSPEDADLVLHSPYADLYNVNGNKVLAGVFNRFKQDINFDDIRLRLALNLAVDRKSLIQKGFHGYADEVPALTPPWAFDFPEELEPRSFEPEKARKLFKDAGYPLSRPFQLATSSQYKKAAYLLATQLRESLHVKVEITVFAPNEEVKWRRIVAEKQLAPDWDLLLIDAVTLFLEATPAFFHREFFGLSGALRTGPVIPEFEDLFQKMAAQTNPVKLLQAAKDIDRYIYKQALGLFLCNPQDLYAVNKHVNFKPYRTSLEFAETSVTPSHWSRR